MAAAWTLQALSALLAVLAIGTIMWRLLVSSVLEPVIFCFLVNLIQPLRKSLSFPVVGYYSNSTGLLAVAPSWLDPEGPECCLSLIRSTKKSVSR